MKTKDGLPPCQREKFGRKQVSHTPLIRQLKFKSRQFGISKLYLSAYINSLTPSPFPLQKQDEKVQFHPTQLKSSSCHTVALSSDCKRICFKMYGGTLLHRLSTPTPLHPRNSNCMLPTFWQPSQTPRSLGLSGDHGKAPQLYHQLRSAAEMVPTITINIASYRRET
jgi:hypothetical protein